MAKDGQDMAKDTAAEGSAPGVKRVTPYVSQCFRACMLCVESLLHMHVTGLAFY